jgi:hypothetical protein
MAQFMAFVKNLTTHAFVLILMLVLAIGAVRFLGVSTNVIRAVPLLYFFYLSVVFIVHGVRQSRVRRRKDR